MNKHVTYSYNFITRSLHVEPIPFGSSESDLVLIGDDRTGARLDAPTGVFVGDGTAGIFSYVLVYILEYHFSIRHCSLCRVACVATVELFTY